jgi:hypothetical protein
VTGESWNFEKNSRPAQTCLTSSSLCVPPSTLSSKLSPAAFGNFVYTNILGLPANVLALLVLYALAWAYLNFTKGGRTIYAIGSNREAARTAGLNVLGFSTLPYVISGGLSALAITFSSAQVMSIDPGRYGPRAGRYRRGRYRRSEPIWRTWIDCRDADRGLNYGYDPKRIEPPERFAVLARIRHRRNNYYRGLD